MPNKQTRCPSCKTVYKVSVPQLTVAQGMVCCPKCNFTFNALTNIVEIQHPDLNFIKTDNQKLEQKTFIPTKLPNTTLNENFKVLDIFSHKVENSNIDLLTYLNSLNYFNHEPINANPSLNLSSNNHLTAKINIQHGHKYYIFWGLINLLLSILLAYQFLWFNPSLTNQSHLLSYSIHKLNQLFGIESLDQRYQHIIATQIIIEYSNNTTLEFSGVLINNYKKSLKMPFLKIDLLSNGQKVKSKIIPPSEYLIPTLQGIERIPNNSPFYFQFSLIKPKNGFDNYQIEVIEP